MKTILVPCGGGFKRDIRYCRFPPCDGNIEEEYRLTKTECNPHTCEDNYLNGSEIIAHSPFTARQNRRCVFPFTFQGEEYRKCVKSSVIAPPTDRSIEVYSESQQWCGLVEDVDMSPEEWAMCSADFIGTWSTWTDLKCTERCFILQERYCIVAECIGESERQTVRCAEGNPVFTPLFDPCYLENIGECVEPIWNDWSSWTCNCDKETVRTRTCDGGKFGLTCLGDPHDKRKIRNKAQLDTCNPSDLEECDESDLNDFLNLQKEIKVRACSNLTSSKLSAI